MSSSSVTSFGPSEQQLLLDEQLKQQRIDNRALIERLPSLSKEELIRLLETQLIVGEKLQSEIHDLREEKVKLNLVLEEEDERRANMFLKRMQELEAAKSADKLCPKCASVILETTANSSTPTSRSNSIVVTGHGRSMASLSEDDPSL
jgi:hypothetical protein